MVVEPADHFFERLLLVAHRQHRVAADGVEDAQVVRDAALLRLGHPRHGRKRGARRKACAALGPVRHGVLEHRRLARRRDAVERDEREFDELLAQVVREQQDLDPRREHGASLAVVRPHRLEQLRDAPVPFVEILHVDVLRAQHTRQLRLDRANGHVAAVELLVERADEVAAEGGGAAGVVDGDTLCTGRFFDDDCCSDSRGQSQRTSRAAPPERCR